MTPAKPYFYNSIENITDEDYEKALKTLFEKFDEYEKILNDYDRWKNLVKSYNKFIVDKARKRDSSRFAWHSETDRFKKRLKEFETASKEEIVSTAYNDSFYSENVLYYPVDYPQIFRVALALDSINQLYSSEEDTLKYLQDLPETCLLGATDEDHIEYKDISENISKFFKDYPKGMIYISNGR